MQINLVFTGPDRADAMRESIIKMIEHNISQAIAISRGANSVKQAARHAGEVAAFQLMLTQLHSIQLDCNNS